MYKTDGKSVLERVSFVYTCAIYDQGLHGMRGSLWVFQGMRLRNLYDDHRRISEFLGRWRQGNLEQLGIAVASISIIVDGHERLAADKKRRSCGVPTLIDDDTAQIVALLTGRKSGRTAATTVGQKHRVDANRRVRGANPLGDS